MRSSNIHIPGCYIIGTVIAAGHREAVMGTVGVIKAVGQNDIPPKGVETPGVKLGVGANMAAGNAAPIEGTVGGTAAMRAVGQNDIPPPNVGKVGAKVGVIKGVSPGVKVGTGAVISAVIPGAKIGSGAVIRTGAVLTGVVMTARPFVAAKHKTIRIKTVMNKHLLEFMDKYLRTSLNLYNQN